MPSPTSTSPLVSTNSGPVCVKRDTSPGRSWSFNRAGISWRKRRCPAAVGMGVSFARLAASAARERAALWAARA